MAKIRPSGWGSDSSRTTVTHPPVYSRTRGVAPEGLDSEGRLYPFPSWTFAIMVVTAVEDGIYTTTDGRGGQLNSRNTVYSTS